MKIPSRQESKRLLNLAQGLATQAGNLVSYDREKAEMSNKALRNEVLKLQREKANALALLEAFVRRHGTSTFDRPTVQGVCARGQIAYDVDPDRITIRLSGPREVPDPGVKVV